METPLLKELIDLWTEDNATATGLHNIHNLGQGATKQVVEDQAPVEDSPLKDMINLGMEATWLLSNLNSGGAGEQAVEDQAVVDAPPLKDRAAMGPPGPRT